jgi:hypothetical protein
MRFGSPSALLAVPGFGRSLFDWNSVVRGFEIRVAETLALALRIVRSNGPVGGTRAAPPARNG